MPGFSWAQADFVQATMVQSSGDPTSANVRKPTWLLETTFPVAGAVRFATLDLPLDVQHEGVILDCSGITRELVDVFWGTTEIREVTLRLANPAGRFTPDYAADLAGVPFRLRRYDWGACIASAQLTGVWTQAALDVGVLTLRGTNMDLSVFEQEIPKGRVTAEDWPNALDLGAPLPIVIGSVARVPGLVVNYDPVAGLTDVLFSRGTVTIVRVLRNLGEYQTIVTPTEYATSTTLYPGFTVLRFTTLQRDFQNAPHRFWADIEGRQAERNAVRLIETLLTDDTWGLDQTVDATAFGAAAEAEGVVELLIDAVLREPAQAQTLLRDLLLLRGMRLGVTSAGAWTISVDRLRETPALTLADGLGDGPRTLLSAGQRRRPALEDRVSDVVVRYRPDFGGDGRLLLEARRTVSALGKEREVASVYLRDRDTADRVADYLAKRLAIRETVEIEATQAAQGLLEGELVTLTFAPLDYAAATLEVSRVDVALDRVRATLGAYDPDVYTYDPGTLPDEDPRGTFDDWSRTPPGEATLLTRIADGTTQAGGGDVSAWADLQFTTPEENYSESRVSFRVTGTTAWEYGRVVTSEAGEGVVVRVTGLVPGLAYDFTVETVNAPGTLVSLTGPLLLGQVAPGDTTAPATPATPTVGGKKLSSVTFVWTQGTEVDLLRYDWDLRTASGGGGSLVASGSTPGPGSLFTGDFAALSWDTTYYFRVRAVDRSGNTSAYSTAVSFSIVRAATDDVSDDAVTTPKVATNAVTQTVTASEASLVTTTSTSFATLSGMSVTLTTQGGPVLLLLGLHDIFLQNLHSGALTVQGFVRLKRDSTVLATADFSAYLDATGPTRDYQYFPTAVPFLDPAPSAGSHTYLAEWAIVAAATNPKLGSYSRYIQATEFKR